MRFPKCRGLSSPSFLRPRRPTSTVATQRQQPQRTIESPESPKAQHTNFTPQKEHAAAPDTQSSPFAPLLLIKGLIQGQQAREGKKEDKKEDKKKRWDGMTAVATALIAGLGVANFVKQDESSKRIDDTNKRFYGLEQRIDGRIDGLEQRIDGRIDGLEQRIDGRIDGLEQRIDGRFDGLERRIDIMIAGFVGSGKAKESGERLV